MKLIMLNKLVFVIHDGAFHLPVQPRCRKVMANENLYVPSKKFSAEKD